MEAVPGAPPSAGAAGSQQGPWGGLSPPVVPPLTMTSYQGGLIVRSSAGALLRSRASIANALMSTERPPLTPRAPGKLPGCVKQHWKHYLLAVGEGACRDLKLLQALLVAPASPAQRTCMRRRSSPARVPTLMCLR